MSISFWSNEPKCVSLDFRYVSHLCGCNDLYPMSAEPDGFGSLIGLTIIYYENLSRKLAKEDHEQFEGLYLLDRLTGPMLKSLNERKSFLFIDYSGEPAIVDENVLVDFYEELALKGIQPSQVILATCNWKFSGPYKQWCSKNGREPIHVIIYDHFLYHFSGTANANSRSERLSIEENIRTFSSKTRDKKKLVCLNNMPRVHRFAVCTLLIDRGLDKISYMSMLQSVAVEQLGELRSDVQGYFEGLNVDEDSFNRLMARIPITADRPKGHPRGDLAGGLGDLEMYRTSRFSLVTESDVFGDDVLRVTEKVLKPIINGQLFITVGNYETMAHLRKRGFRTFDDYIDQTYDRIVDPKLRVGAALRSALDLAEMPFERFDIISEATRKDLLHNSKLMWEFADRYRKDPIHEQIRSILKAV